jgi:hypothetical protein
LPQQLFAVIEFERLQLGAVLDTIDQAADVVSAGQC